MSFSKAGFKNSLYGLNGSNSGGGSGSGLKVNQIPTTSDYITWILPTGGIPIQQGTLSVMVNGMNQTDFLLLSDGYSFQWLSADPIFPDDDVTTTYII